ncbi:unnamed protein product [Mytilus edulis]|uniref:Uncharacterized protein n=1 Tax=Mytilus edulis TaxID=6550 RepID=A0A8S3VJI2_MYTED|nr:unnamed protein product [Mytilus edulis]
MQTNQSAYKPFDIMSDGFTGLTIDKKIEDVQPSCDQQNRDSNENITTERNNVFPTMDAMNSQITQDGLQSYHQEFKYPQFQSVDARYRSFDTWRFTHKQTPRKLSEAGYFYTGEEDTVRCHYCDGGLRNWEPKDVPWEEHARWFPFCKFVIKMKGREFIEYIKRKSEEKQRLENSTSTSSSSGLPDDIRDSPVVKQLTTIGIDEDNIRYAITEFTKEQVV